MKRKISLSLLIIFALSFALLVFAGCNDTARDNGDSGDKQIPVYQGMTITSAETEELMASGLGKFMTLSKTDNNGNHYGQYKGDHADRNEEIDKEDPFPDNSEAENIEEEIKSSLNVVESPDTIYYATPNEDIYINIHIDNPDSFEIMSFTLNGKKYSSYMFEAGSDMETIVLKYNVGDAEGIVEYTIDAIKYVDGTEIKDVLIDGNKTVMAGIKTESQVLATVTELDIGTNAVSFKVSVDDRNSLLEFSQGTLKAVVYDGESIIAEADIALGDNSVAFEGLATNTLYQYAIVGFYDDLSGNGFGMNMLYKEAFYTDSVVLFDNITVEQDSISFNFVWHEDHQGKEILDLKLYNEDGFVKEVETDATSITELFSNSYYKLIASYYNGQDVVDAEVEYIMIEFTTPEKAAPSISLGNPTKTQTSIGFELTETDTDNVGEVAKIELISKNGTVIADSADIRSFEDLFTNTAYTVKVTYVYDLNDGEGEHTIVKELSITTLEKATPNIAVDEDSVDISQNSIKADYEIDDADSVLLSYKVELYKGETLVATNAQKEILFYGLSYYTDYTLKITYVYDLNDGNGNQTRVIERTYKTQPYIDVTECDIANTSSVSEGDTIYMSVKLNNPLNMTVESVVINGETYRVTGASTKNKIFVEIVYNGQFVGGDTYLKIEKVNAKLDSKTSTIVPETELSDNVFINGKIEVLKVEFVNEKFEAVDWAFPAEKLYIMITLDNPTGYNIDGIVQGGTGIWDADWGSVVDEYHDPNTVSELIRIDNNHWYYEVCRFDGGSWAWRYLQSLSYSLNDLHKTLTYSDFTSLVYIVASDEVKYITNADDLKNMNDGYYYELTNDIDLKGIEWHGGEFNGVFNGKGYSIKNMSFVGTVKNSGAKLGLFSDGRGVIQNLNIKEATIIANVTSDDGHVYELCCGGIVAWMKDVLNIHNCHVDEYSTFSVKNDTDINGYAAVGGLVGFNEGATLTVTDSTNAATVSGRHAGGLNGYAADTIIERCTNRGDINGEYAGGLIGYVWNYSDVIIKDCSNEGDVTDEPTSNWGHIGGFVGDMAFESNIIITNSINIGDIMAEAKSGFCGGFVGNNSGSEIVVTNSVNGGAISGSYAGGIIGHGYSEVQVIDNSYSVVSIPNKEFNGKPCTADRLNTNEFYTETLSWSEDVWDLSDLDVESGKYPKLK